MHVHVCLHGHCVKHPCIMQILTHFRLFMYHTIKYVNLSGWCHMPFKVISCISFWKISLELKKELLIKEGN